jgi:hypothetical protein
MGSQFLIRFVAGQPMAGTDHHRVGDDINSPLPLLAGSQALIQGRPIQSPWCGPPHRFTESGSWAGLWCLGGSSPECYALVLSSLPGVTSHQAVKRVAVPKRPMSMSDSVPTGSAPCWVPPAIMPSKRLEHGSASSCHGQSRTSSASSYSIPKI